MKLGFSADQEAFRSEVGTWLDKQLSGPFAELRNHKGLTEKVAERKRWERALYDDGWGCISCRKNLDALPRCRNK